ncbi:MAG TPA: acyltransferase [Microthrixaceae bacterium]|nr:acyltransferase [Microthrixaceae bacterium]
MSETAETSPTLMERLAQPSARRMGWSPALDGVRGLGVVLVMLYHYLGDYNFYVRGFPVLIDLFFVLSGFLITTLMFEERQKRGSVSLRAFYMRRVFRLFPALYSLLAVFLVYIIFLGGDNRGQYFQEFLAAGLYFYNFYIAWTGVVGQVLVQLWTLSVEEQFYFIWPICFIWMMKGLSNLRLRVALSVMVSFVVVWPILRMTLDSELGERTLSSFVFGLAIMRPDSIVLGCLAAMAFRLEPVDLGPRARMLAARSGDVALVIFLMALCLGGFRHFGPFVSVAANLAVLVLALWVLDLVRNPDRVVARLLANPRLVWLGKRSYGLYIWHMLVYFVIHGIVAGVMPGKARLVVLVSMPIAFAATLGVAILSWNFIEGPALRIKKRFET